MKSNAFRMSFLRSLSRPGLLGLALTMGWASACTPATPSEQAPAETPHATPTEGAPASPNMFEGHFLLARPLFEVDSLRAPARALSGPSAQHEVTPPFAGFVTELRVRAGDTVQRGAPLSILSLPELATLSAEYITATEEVGLLQDRKARLQELQKGGIGRAQEILDTNLTLAQSTGRQRLAAARLKAARIPLAAAAVYVANGGRYTLRVPTDGVVRALDTHPGAAATPTAPIAVIDSAAAVRIEADIAPGLVDAPWDTWRFEHDRGTVMVREVGRSPRIDDHTGLRRVWFEPVADAHAVAFAGASGTLRPHTDEDLLVVPEAALTLRARRASSDAPTASPDEPPAADAAAAEIPAARDASALTRTADGLVAHDVQVVARTAGLAVVRGLPPGVTVALKKAATP